MFTILSFSCSCANFRKTADYSNRSNLTYDNIANLNGIYKRFSQYGKDSVKNDLFCSFYNLCVGRYFIPDSIKINPENDIVTFDFYKKRRLSTIFSNGSIIYKEKIARYKIKDDYCVFRRKYFIVPSGFFNIFRTRKFRFATLKDGNLVGDFHETAFGTGFLIIPFFSKEKLDNTVFYKVSVNYLKN